MKKCKVKNCNRIHLANGYCRKHYHQIRDYGKIIKRTIYDKNEIIEHNNYCEVILYDINCNESGRTTIDKESLNEIIKYKWRLNSKRYVITDIPSGNGKKILLHRLITKPLDNIEIDHIDRNPLNNRISNLRFATRQENNRNTKGLGVCWHKQSKKWRAYIMINYKQISLGLFNYKKDALISREKAELKYFKEFAKKK